MWRRLLAACGLVLCVSSGAARAETLTVGVEDLDYLPHYGVKDGRYGGFAAAVLDAFAAASGHTLRYRPFPVERLFQTFFAGDVDLKYPDNAHWKADEKKPHNVTYSAPVVEFIDGVVVLADRKGQSPDLIGRLGTVRGFTPWSWLDRIAAGKPTLVESTGFEPLLSLTMIGRVDGAYANVSVVRHVLTETLKKPKALVFDPGLPHNRGFYHLSSIKRADVIAQFDRWMAANPATMTKLKESFGVDVVNVAGQPTATQIATSERGR